jgi:hypothetical protein
MHKNFGLATEGREHLVDPDTGGKILEWILRKQGRKGWTEVIWLRIGFSGVN